MKLSDFDYTIPDNQIAQHPLKVRDSSRLLVVHRESGTFEHRTFRDIIEYLDPRDVLVLNNTKVFPARLRGSKPTGGRAEITLLKEVGPNVWEALVKGMHEGQIILEHGIRAAVSRVNGTLARVNFSSCSGRDIKEFLNDIGAMPLPVYIKREPVRSDSQQYQTVYAEKDGAVAAPTAGLHFTDNLLERIRDKGTDIKTITLHVGYGTFKPVIVSDIRDHRMEREFYEVPEAAAVAVNSAKSEGRRVIAVGTTVTRALESSAHASKTNSIAPGTGEASMFIYPGYQYRIVDMLLTNFHLPKSTPMMLASAFTGLDLLKRAYRESQDKGYRFFSYGDAMLIL